MTRDPRADPLPPSEPRLKRLAKMPQAELVKFYAAALEMCQFTHGKPPRAPFIQQLVQAWGDRFGVPMPKAATKPETNVPER